MFRSQSGNLLNPDDYLKRYNGRTNAAELPKSSINETAVRASAAVLISQKTWSVGKLIEGLFSYSFNTNFKNNNNDKTENTRYRHKPSTCLYEISYSFRTFF